MIAPLAPSVSAKPSAPAIPATLEPRRPAAPADEGDFISAVRRTWDILFGPDAVVEMRVLKTGNGAATGYFDNPSDLARVAERHNGESGVYVTLNELPAPLLARSMNRLHNGTATSDKDVARRRWVLADFDPERASGISSTDAEHEAAITRARDVHSWLVSEGCPAGSLVLADSGNGAHVLVRVDLPNDGAAKVLVQRVLEAIALRFGDEKVKVDRTTANASRVTKLYGTTAVKGSNTPSRRHRPATILDAPNTITPAPTSLLDKVAAYAPDPEKWGAEVSTGKRYDIPALLEKLRTDVGIDLGEIREKPWSGGQLWEAQVCPWDDAHNNRAFCIIQFANGAVAAKCHHDGCAGKGWREFRELFPSSAFPAPAAVTGDAAADVNRTDLGNAERFIAQHGNAVRYVTDARRWLVWNGTAWRPDEAAVVTLGKQTVRSLYDEIATQPTHDAQRKMLSHCMASSQTPRIEGMIRLAQSDARITVKQDALDSDPWSLTVLNGTINLRNGELRRHASTDLITKVAPVRYDPSATLDLWDRFVAETTGGDTELARFLRQAAGYTLTGNTGAEVLFFAYGAGATGKSTFLDALRSMLGDYATMMNFGSLVSRAHEHGGSARSDVVRLRGMRMVSSVEIDNGRSLAEGLIKALTGGDEIVARGLFQSETTFRPQAKFWLCANHQPKVSDNDDALWRRIRVVPFTHVVPESKRDETVKARLRDPNVGGPAILAWAVRGLLDYRANGFTTPTAVKTATQAYRAQMDPLEDFWGETCVSDPEAWTSSEMLWSAYGRWVGEQGVGGQRERAISKKAFWHRLAARNCTPEKHGHTRGWRGVRLAGGVREIAEDDVKWGPDIRASRKMKEGK